ncbi:MAG TPA: ATP-binding cassette domain-containing protein, partial [Pseudomonadota bacterium]|nr:ATP-binding cassette domain-containing protein [Pseudomonadota bacterium]
TQRNWVTGLAATRDGKTVLASGYDRTVRVIDVAKKTETAVLDGFTARIDGRTVLKDISFRLERRGVYAVMGPGGSGKSTLASILGGQNRASGGWSFEGLCEYNGRPLGQGRRPICVPQVPHRPSLSLSSYLRSESPQPDSLTTEQLEAKLRQARLARLLPELDTELSRIVPPLSESEWWRLAITRALLPEPELLCVDEPTAGLSEREAAPIIDLLKAEGLRRAVLFVTHNQQHARVISHSTLLIAGGRLQEMDTTEVFFSGPSSRAGQDYVRTGGCYVPSPDALSEHLSEEFQPETAEPPTLAALTESPQPPSVAPSVTPSAVPSVAPSVPTVAPDVATLWSGPPGGARPVLSLRRFSLRVGTRQLLSEVSLDLADRGLYVLAIPDGVSKRMLMRALCGPRPANFHIDGQASYGDGTLGDGNSPATPQGGAQLLMMSVALYIGSALSEQAMSKLEQRTTTQRLLHDAGFPELLERLDHDMTSVEPAERRVLEILRATVGNPRVLVLEDPLAGLPVGPRERVVAVLQKQARLRSLLLVSQDDLLARELNAPHGWLVDGCTTTQPPPPEPEPEPEPVPVIIAPAPPPPAAPAPSLSSERRDEADSPPTTDYAEPEPARPLGRGPRGFQWLRPGVLAGMPAPGMTYDLAYDLDLVRGAGITHLVTLTQETLPGEKLRAHGLISLHFPIVDMDVPSEEAAARLASQIAELVAAGRSVGFHCKAGLGRTGTMLACQLIWEGVPAPQALTQVRSVEPGWIQSDKQVAFLGRFEDWLRRMWPMEQGQRKKRSASPHEHPNPQQGAVMTAKKEKTDDIT